MALVTYEQLKAIVNNVVTTSLISNGSFVETRNNLVGLLDKIGKIHTLDTVFTIDKLARFEGQFLSFGKTVEEWQQDLILPEDYDANGSYAMTPHVPTYRPVFYSYTLGRKKIPTSIYNDNIERAVHNEGQFAEIVAVQYKRLEDSMAQYRYGVKRDMIAKLYSLCAAEMDLSAASTYAISTAYSVGDIVKASGSPTTTAIVFKAIANTNTNTYAQAIAAGQLVELDLITEIAKPVDTSTSAEFIKQVKHDVEVAQDSNQGHSLNGNCLGVSESLVLIVRQGILPQLEVESYAGAFNREDLAVPAEIITVKDFGSASSDVYAVLMDSRGMRLYNTYNATRENFNGDGDFLNLFRHTEDTAAISRNTFVKFYVVPSN